MMTKRVIVFQVPAMQLGADVLDGATGGLGESERPVMTGL